MAKHEANSWSEDGINFRTRKWVRPEDLNANGSLFGGSLLKWIDEEAAIYAIVQLGNYRAVTKLISEINFEASAVQGDLIADLATAFAGLAPAAQSLGRMTVPVESRSVGIRSRL